MGARAVRRLERSMEVEPVVSYSLIPPDDAGKKAEDDGRVEPRLTVLPMERRARSAEVIAPTSEDAALHGTRFEAKPLDPLPPEPRARGRRRLPIFAFGLAVLLVAFGVLAATFGKVMTGGNVAAVAPADETPTVALAPPPPATEETAGPGVRIIPPDGNNAASVEAPASAAPAAVAPAATTTETAALPAPAETPSAAPANPPLPRLRPTTPTVVTGQAAPSAGAGAPASSDSDVNALMSDVDRILSQHRAAGPEPVPLPAPTATADAGFPAPAGAAPLQVMPPPAQPARRGWFLYPTRDASGLPVPPADIPDPEGAPGQ